MNLQDILTLVSGPQGWLLIGGGILLLLVLLVYRRLGKMAVATRNDLAEMRQTLAQFADRLDTVQETVISSFPADGGEKVSLASAGPIVAEESEVFGEDTYGYAAAPGIEEDGDLSEVGALYAPDAGSEVPGDLSGVAEESEVSGEDAYGYAAAPGTEDDGDLSEVGSLYAPDAEGEVPGDLSGAAEESEVSGEDTYGYAAAPGIEDDGDLSEVGSLYAPDADSEVPGDLPGAAEELEVSGEDTYGYAVAPGIEDDGDLSEVGSLYAPDADSEVPGDLPGAAEESEVSGEDAYGYAAVPGIEDDADLSEFGEVPTPDVVGAFPGKLQDAADAQEDFDEFQFSTSASPKGTDSESSLETQQCASDEMESPVRSSEESESFTFGSGGQIPEGEEIGLPQSESRQELLPGEQPSDDGGLETTGQAPGENAIDSVASSQPASQVSFLEPMPGDPDRPQVGVARCGECGRKIAYPKRLSGKRMRCPACRATSILP